MKRHAQHTYTHSHIHRRTGGYSMIELLIAMGIFAIGFVSLAAMFPAAVQMQKRTMEDVVTKQVLEQARSVGPMFGADDTAASEPGGTDQTVRMPRLNEVWPLAERSFPTSIYNPVMRDYFLVPVVRRNESLQKWEVITFVTKREGNAVYTASGTVANSDDPQSVPKVVKLNVSLDANDLTRFNFGNDTDNNGIADQVRMGDMIVDSNGVIYRVRRADPQGANVNSLILADRTSGKTAQWIWYGKPPSTDRVSPTRDITTHLANARPVPCTVIVDNSGTVERIGSCGSIDGVLVGAGGWSSDSASGYPRTTTTKNHVYAAKTNSSYFTYRFTNVPPGTYEVYVTWVPFTSTYRSTNVPYRIRELSGVTIVQEKSFTKNQVTGGDLADTDPKFNDVPFELLDGSFQTTTASGTIEVGVTAFGTQNYAVADAVVLKQVQ